MGSGCGDYESLSRLVERMAGPYAGQGFGPTGAWSPPTDVFETATGVIVKMELPGVRSEDLSIVLLDDRLFVRGCRKDPDAGVKLRYHQMEIAYGGFVKVVTIRMRYDREGIRATLTDGFLSLLIPRAEKPAAGRVAVEIRL
ncbi:MAG: Hsp20/alpha crystallin family protein [Planctomycetes bacterium]|jgi:HSP20 family protein|nr:Hsp20/alpha crystallin family protein [Planctomycetota bacterium]